MNNLEKIYMEHQIAGFAVGYFRYLSELMRSLDIMAIEDFMYALEFARVNNQTIFVVGNGGSASTASHIATDIGMALEKVQNPGEPFRVMALTDNAALMTALGNDYGYEDIFTKQLNVHYKDGDVLVVISASGNSPNVVKAAEWVHARGGKVLGLLGFDGGALQAKCDVAITAKTPKGEYGPVEDVHLIVNHMFTSWLQFKYRNSALTPA
jgi:D-sedoheptulose 7-phosphate isomerase